MAEFWYEALSVDIECFLDNYGHQAIVNLLGSSLVGSKEGEATLSTAFQVKRCFKLDKFTLCQRIFNSEKIQPN